jgi:hypothetical protein
VTVDVEVGQVPLVFAPMAVLAIIYGLIWFGMFAASEVGDAISGRSSWREASLGILSEVIYAPVSAFIAYTLLGVS